MYNSNPTREEKTFCEARAIYSTWTTMALRLVIFTAISMARLWVGVPVEADNYGNRLNNV
jgi:hypothetical protein